MSSDRHKMTPDNAARLASAAERGKIVLLCVNNPEEEAAAKAEGWTDDYAALPAAPKVGIN